MGVKLNQVLAIEKGEKTRANTAITDLHKKAMKPDLYEGFMKTYTPSDEEGEAMPPESKLIQQKNEAVLKDATEILTKLWDITATKDVTNSKTNAAVVIDGDVLIRDMPVSYLLFLEKQLNDLYTFVAKIPVLDPSVRWNYSSEQSCMTAEPITTNKTKKVLRNHVQAKATKEHPEQVQTYHEDIITGHWNNIRYSGAMEAEKKEKILDRIVKLKNAIKYGREEANTVEAVHTKVGEKLFEYVLGA